MKHLSPSLVLLLLAGSLTLACSRPVQIVLDTDWWTDVDDAMAVRLLANLQSDKVLELKGINLCAYDSTSVETLSKFMVYEGLGDLPLAVDKQAGDYPGHPNYRQAILNDSTVKARCHTLDDCEDCVEFYRRILAGSRKKVDIVSVGFANALARLLESGPDRYSPLDGETLVRRKVGHLWMMAGQFPEGREHNIHLSQRSREAARTVCTRWPTPVTFLGFEVGIRVEAGGKLSEGDLLHDILVAYGAADGRYSWDPMTVLLAASGSPEAAGYDSVRGTVVVDTSDGSNSFVPSPDGPHSYVVMKEDPQFYLDLLNGLLVSRR